MAIVTGVVVILCGLVVLYVYVENYRRRLLDHEYQKQLENMSPSRPPGVLDVPPSVGTRDSGASAVSMQLQLQQPRRELVLSESDL